MNKIFLASALSAAFVSPTAFAQAKNFEGFGIQLSTGYQNNASKYSNVKIDGSRTNTDSDLGPTGLAGFSNSSSGSAPLNIGLSMTTALSNNFTLGLLAEYNPISMNEGSSNLTLAGQNIADTAFKSKLENQVSISLVPGYAFTNETMGYAKIGWVTATAKMTPNDNSGDNLNTNVNGYLLGLGVKHLFTKNIYGFAEANYIGYSAGSATAADAFPDGQVTSLGYTNTPTSYNFLVGVGYKF